MSQDIRPVRGTKDLFDKDYLLYQHVIKEAKEVAECFCYQTMLPPIFEYTSVFSRTMGETSDVVSKEMYSFDDRSGHNITLRPEFTAAIMRSFISNGLSHQLPLKIFSYGPVFRHERPQNYRLRQFHQINFEYLGLDQSFIDVEIIAMAAHILEKLGVLAKTTLELNSLGDNETRKNYQHALVDYFNSYQRELSPDSKIRLTKNPMRILDSKDENDQKIIKDAPIYSEYYNDYSRNFFEAIKENLTSFGIKYQINERLVRGLDYYNHTTFEFITNELGAKGTVLAGGRYNGLVKIMGGADTPAIGFAAGIERLCGLIDYQPVIKRPIMLISVGQNMIPHAHKISQLLRQSNIITEINYKHDVGKQLQKSLAINASHAVFIGEEELLQNKVKVKDLDKRTEELIDLTRLIDFLKR